MYFFDLILLVLISFFVLNFVQKIFHGRSNLRGLNPESDSLKQTQDLSKEQSLLTGMSESQREGFHDSMTLSICFARFALQVALSDGVLTRSEIDSILLFFKGAHPSFTQRVQEVLEQDLNHPQTVDWDYNLREAKRILAKPQWNDFSAIIFDGLIRISLADGIFDSKEHTTISVIMSDLGWNRQRIESWFHTRTGFGEAYGGQSDKHEGHYQYSQNRPASDRLKRSEALDVLALTTSSLPEEIKKRYRELVREHHPDKYAHMGFEMQKTATERFQIIQEAYDYIVRS